MNLNSYSTLRFFPTTCFHRDYDWNCPPTSEKFECIKIAEPMSTLQSANAPRTITTMAIVCLLYMEPAIFGTIISLEIYRNNTCVQPPDEIAWVSEWTA